MNIFQKIGFINRLTKAIEKSKKLIDEKKDLAEKVRKHLNNIGAEIQEVVRLLPDLRNVYFEALEIIDNIKVNNIKWKSKYKK